MDLIFHASIHQLLGKLTVYLGKRDVVDRCDGVVDPIEGVILIDNKYLEHRRVFGEV